MAASTQTTIDEGRLTQLHELMAKKNAAGLSATLKETITSVKKLSGQTQVNAFRLAAESARWLSDEGYLTDAIEVRELLASLPSNRQLETAAADNLTALAQLRLKIGDVQAAIIAVREAIRVAASYGDLNSDAHLARLHILLAAAKSAADRTVLSEAQRSLADLTEIEDRGPSRLRTTEAVEPPTLDDAPSRLWQVHFATHRERDASDEGNCRFSARRASSLAFGKALVSVPTKREPGDTPVRRDAKDRRADPARHFIIKASRLLDGKDTFLEDIQEQLELSSAKEALVFIHGYDNTFEDAVIRTAQLANDLEIGGAAIAYCWPSCGSFLSYIVDRNQKIEPFIDDLAVLLVDIARKSGAKHVHLIAHSVGAEFLLDALAAILSSEAGGAPTGRLFDEVVYAAPDVDASHFIRKAPKLTALSRRTTVYASSTDWALSLSGRINGSKRAGADAAAIAIDAYESIDTSDAAQDMIGHTDYASTALDDLRAVLWFGLSPRRRQAVLQSVQELGRQHWRFLPERPMDRDGPFREALVWARRVGMPAAVVIIAATVKAMGIKDAALCQRLDRVAAQLRTIFPNSEAVLPRQG